MIGNWFELFDFIIYGYFAARIGHPMFPESDPVTIILSSFATYAGSAQARGHGADPVTSIGLHLTPELMRMSAARPAMRSNAFGLPATGQFAGVTFGGFEVALPLDVTEVASNGVGQGDPTLASAAAGARFSDWIVGAVADFIAHFRRCDPARPHLGPQPS